MDKLQWDLMQLCKRNRDGSFSTQAARGRILDLAAREFCLGAGAGAEGPGPRRPDGRQRGARPRARGDYGGLLGSVIRKRLLPLGYFSEIQCISLFWVEVENGNNNGSHQD